jgi:hypothetical protein
VCGECHCEPQVWQSQDVWNEIATSAYSLLAKT